MGHLATTDHGESAAKLEAKLAEQNRLWQQGRTKLVACEDKLRDAGISPEGLNIEEALRKRNGLPPTNRHRYRSFRQPPTGERSGPSATTPAPVAAGAAKPPVPVPVPVDDADLVALIRRRLLGDALDSVTDSVDLAALPTDMGFSEFVRLAALVGESLARRQLASELAIAQAIPGRDDTARVAAALLDDAAAIESLAQAAAMHAWQTRPSTPAADHAVASALAAEVVDGVGLDADPVDVQSVVTHTPLLESLDEPVQAATVAAALQIIDSATTFDYYGHGYAQFDPATATAGPDLSGADLSMPTDTVAAQLISDELAEGWWTAAAEFTSSLWLEIQQELANDPAVVAALARPSGAETAEAATQVLSARLDDIAGRSTEYGLAVRAAEQTRASVHAPPPDWVAPFDSAAVRRWQDAVSRGDDETLLRRAHLLAEIASTTTGLGLSGSPDDPRHTAAITPPADGLSTSAEPLVSPPQPPTPVVVDSGARSDLPGAPTATAEPVAASAPSERSDVARPATAADPTSHAVSDRALDAAIATTRRHRDSTPQQSLFDLGGDVEQPGAHSERVQAVSEPTPEQQSETGTFTSFAPASEPATHLANIASPSPKTLSADDELAVLASARHHLIEIARTGTETVFHLGVDPLAWTTKSDAIATLTTAGLLETTADSGGVERVLCTPAGNDRLSVLQSRTRRDPDLGDQVVDIVSGRLGIVCGYTELDDVLRWAEIVWESTDSPPAYSDDTEPRALVVVRPNLMTRPDAVELYRNLIHPEGTTPQPETSPTEASRLDPVVIPAAESATVSASLEPAGPGPGSGAVTGLDGFEATTHLSLNLVEYQSKSKRRKGKITHALHVTDPFEFGSRAGGRFRDLLQGSKRSVIDKAIERGWLRPTPTSAAATPPSGLAPTNHVTPQHLAERDAVTLASLPMPVHAATPLPASPDPRWPLTEPPSDLLKLTSFARAFGWEASVRPPALHSPDQEFWRAVVRARTGRGVREACIEFALQPDGTYAYNPARSRISDMLIVSRPEAQYGWDQCEPGQLVHTRPDIDHVQGMVSAVGPDLDDLVREIWESGHIPTRHRASNLETAASRVVQPDQTTALRDLLTAIVLTDPELATADHGQPTELPGRIRQRLSHALQRIISTAPEVDPTEATAYAREVALDLLADTVTFDSLAQELDDKIRAGEPHSARDQLLVESLSAIPDLARARSVELGLDLTCERVSGVEYAGSRPVYRIEADGLTYLSTASLTQGLHAVWIGDQHHRGWRYSNNASDHPDIALAVETGWAASTAEITTVMRKLLREHTDQLDREASTVARLAVTVAGLPLPVHRRTVLARPGEAALPLLDPPPEIQKLAAYARANGWYGAVCPPSFGDRQRPPHWWAELAARTPRGMRRFILHFDLQPDGTYVYKPSASTALDYDFSHKDKITHGWASIEPGQLYHHDSLDFPLGDNVLQVRGPDLDEIAREIWDSGRTALHHSAGPTSQNADASRTADPGQFATLRDILTARALTDPSLAQAGALILDQRVRDVVGTHLRAIAAGSTASFPADMSASAGEVVADLQAGGPDLDGLVATIVDKLQRPQARTDRDDQLVAAVTGASMQALVRGVELGLDLATETISVVENQGLYPVFRIEVEGTAFLSTASRAQGTHGVWIADDHHRGWGRGRTLEPLLTSDDGTAWPHTSGQITVLIREHLRELAKQAAHDEQPQLHKRALDAAAAAVEAAQLELSVDTEKESVAEKALTTPAPAPDLAPSANHVEDLTNQNTDVTGLAPQITEAVVPTVADDTDLETIAYGATVSDEPGARLAVTLAGLPLPVHKKTVLADPANAAFPRLDPPPELYKLAAHARVNGWYGAIGPRGYDNQQRPPHWWAELAARTPRGMRRFSLQFDLQPDGTYTYSPAMSSTHDYDFSHKYGITYGWASIEPGQLFHHDSLDFPLADKQHDVRAPDLDEIAREIWDSGRTALHHPASSTSQNTGTARAVGSAQRSALSDILTARALTDHSLAQAGAPNLDQRVRDVVTSELRSLTAVPVHVHPADMSATAGDVVADLQAGGPDLDNLVATIVDKLQRPQARTDRDDQLVAAVTASTPQALARGVELGLDLATETISVVENQGLYPVFRIEVEGTAFLSTASRAQGTHGVWIADDHHRGWGRGGFNEPLLKPSEEKAWPRSSDQVMVLVREHLRDLAQRAKWAEKARQERQAEQEAAARKADTAHERQQAEQEAAPREAAEAGQLDLFADPAPAPTNAVVPDIEVGVLVEVSSTPAADLNEPVDARPVVATAAEITALSDDQRLLLYALASSTVAAAHTHQLALGETASAAALLSLQLTVPIAESVLAWRPLWQGCAIEVVPSTPAGATVLQLTNNGQLLPDGVDMVVVTQADLENFATTATTALSEQHADADSAELVAQAVELDRVASSAAGPRYPRLWAAVERELSTNNARLNEDVASATDRDSQHLAYWAAVATRVSRELAVVTDDVQASLLRADLGYAEATRDSLRIGLNVRIRAESAVFGQAGTPLDSVTAESVADVIDAAVVDARAGKDPSQTLRRGLEHLDLDGANVDKLLAEISEPTPTTSNALSGQFLNQNLRQLPTWSVLGGAARAYGAFCEHIETHTDTGALDHLLRVGHGVEGEIAQFELPWHAPADSTRPVYVAESARSKVGGATELTSDPNLLPATFLAQLLATDTPSEEPATEVDRWHDYVYTTYKAAVLAHGLTPSTLMGADTADIAWYEAQLRLITAELTELDTNTTDEVAVAQRATILLRRRGPIIENIDRLRVYETVRVGIAQRIHSGAVTFGDLTDDRIDELVGLVQRIGHGHNISDEWSQLERLLDVEEVPDSSAGAIREYARSLNRSVEHDVGTVIDSQASSVGASVVLAADRDDLDTVSEPGTDAQSPVLATAPESVAAAEPEHPQPETGSRATSIAVDEPARRTDDSTPEPAAAGSPSLRPPGTTTAPAAVTGIVIEHNDKNTVIHGLDSHRRRDPIENRLGIYAAGFKPSRNIKAPDGSKTSGWYLPRTWHFHTRDGRVRDLAKRLTQAGVDFVEQKTSPLLPSVTQIQPASERTPTTATSTDAGIDWQARYTRQWAATLFHLGNRAVSPFDAALIRCRVEDLAHQYVADDRAVSQIARDMLGQLYGTRWALTKDDARIDFAAEQLSQLSATPETAARAAARRAAQRDLAAQLRHEGLTTIVESDSESGRDLLQTSRLVEPDWPTNPPAELVGITSYDLLNVDAAEATRLLTVLASDHLPAPPLPGTATAPDAAPVTSRDGAAPTTATSTTQPEPRTAPAGPDDAAVQIASTAEKLTAAVIAAAVGDSKLAQVAVTNGYRRFAELAVDHNSLLGDFISEHLAWLSEQAKAAGDSAAEHFISESITASRVTELAAQVVEAVWDRVRVAPRAHTSPATITDSTSTTSAPILNPAPVADRTQSSTAAPVVNPAPGSSSSNELVDVPRRSAPSELAESAPSNGNVTQVDANVLNRVTSRSPSDTPSVVEGSAQPTTAIAAPLTAETVAETLIADAVANEQLRDLVRANTADIITSSGTKVADELIVAALGDRLDQPGLNPADSAILLKLYERRSELAVDVIATLMRELRQELTEAEAGEGVEQGHSLGAEVVAPKKNTDRIAANLAAIAIVKRRPDIATWIDHVNNGDKDTNPEAFRLRYAASSAEQQTLAGFSGWGAVPELFNEVGSRYKAQRSELLEMVGLTEFRQAGASVLTSYYTPPAIAEVMWEILTTAGLPDNALCADPTGGVGHFVGTAPKNTRMVMVEAEPASGAIAHLLYPGAEVRVHGTERDWADAGMFSAVIGNVPFAKLAVPDLRYNRASHSLHDYVIIKSLHLLAEGGYAALLTSTSTSDNKRTAAREEMAALADLVGAYRLPSGTFAEQAKTDVESDLLIFRRRPAGIDMSEDTKLWIATTPATHHHPSAKTKKTKEATAVTFTVNKYFRENDAHVLGEFYADYAEHGRPALRVKAVGELPLHQQLAARAIPVVAAAADDGHALTAPASPGIAGTRYPFTPGLFDESSVTAHPTPGTLVFHADLGRFKQYRLDGGWALTPAKGAALHQEWAQLLEIGDLVLALNEAAADPESTAPDRAKLRERLNACYDDYRAAYGPINRFVWTKPGRPPSAEQAEKNYQSLATQWRKDHGDTAPNPDNPSKRLPVPFQGDIPDQSEAELRRRASAPTASRRRRGHLEGAIQYDPRVSMARGAELFDDDSGDASKSPIFTTDISMVRAPATHADTVSEAVAICLAETGDLPMARIAELLGISVADATEQTRGLIYPDADSPGRNVLAPVALSGHIRDKLRTAITRQSEDPLTWTPLVEALTKQLPPDITPDRIGVTIGAAWITPLAYRQFISEEFGIPLPAVKAIYLESVSHWTIEAPDRVPTKDQYAVADEPDINGLKLFAKLANNAVIQSPKTKDELEANPGTSFHPERTAALRANAERLQRAFSDWMWSTPERTAACTEMFNDALNSYNRLPYPELERKYPGLNPDIVPYRHQHRGVLRGLCEPALLFDHAVGSGKTYTMIILAMELRRLGLTKQPWIVVPDHLVGPCANSVAHAYPAAKFLVGTEFKNPLERQDFVAATATEDWDLVVVSDSTFSRIPMSPQAQQYHIQQIMTELENAMWASKAVHDDASVKQLKKAVERAKRRLEKVMEAAKKLQERGLSFEQSGCTYIIRDELQDVKNLWRESAVQELALLKGAQRALDILMKADYLREVVRERNIATGNPDALVQVISGATGTPLVGSFADLWVMTRLLRPDLLERAGMSTVDGFARAFIASATDIEVTVTGGVALKTRLTSLMNEAVWHAMESQFRDVVTKHDLPVVLPAVEYVQVQYPMSADQKSFLADLDYRASVIDKDHLEIDNILTIGNIGASMTVDPVSVGLPQPPPEYDRVAVTAAIVAKELAEGAHHQWPATSRGPASTGVTVAVFVNEGTPKPGDRTGLYYRMRAQIVDACTAIGYDITADQIAFVHDYDSAKDKVRLEWEMNFGSKIRVLIGSDPKMSTGYNIQERLAAIIDYSVPQTSTALEQRHGRGHRQGNRLKNVRFYAVISAGSYDPVAWQLIARKAAMIEKQRRGDPIGEDIEFGDDFAITAAQIKAAATGDTLQAEIAQVKGTLRRLELERVGIDRANRAAAHSINELAREVPKAQLQCDTVDIVAAAFATWNELARDVRTISFGKVVLADNSDRLADHTQQALAVATGVAKRDSARRDGVVLLSIAGAEVRLRRNFLAGSYNVSIPGELSFDISDAKMAEAIKTPASTHGFLTRVRNLVASTPKAAAELTGRIAQMQARLAALETAEPRTFDHADELSSLQDRLADLEADLCTQENSPAAIAAREADHAYRLSRGWYPRITLEMNPTPAYADSLGLPQSKVRQMVAAKRAEAQLEWTADELERDTATARDPWVPLDTDGSSFQLGGDPASGRPGGRIEWDGRMWEWSAHDGHIATSDGTATDRESARAAAATAADSLARAHNPPLPTRGLHTKEDFDHTQFRSKWLLDRVTPTIAKWVAKSPLLKILTAMSSDLRALWSYPVAFQLAGEALIGGHRDKLTAKFLDKLAELPKDHVTADLAERLLDTKKDDRANTTHIDFKPTFEKLKALPTAKGDLRTDRVAILVADRTYRLATNSSGGFTLTDPAGDEIHIDTAAQILHVLRRQDRGYTETEAFAADIEFSSADQPDGSTAPTANEIGTTATNADPATIALSAVVGASTTNSRPGGTAASLEPETPAACTPAQPGADYAVVGTVP